MNREFAAEQADPTARPRRPRPRRRVARCWPAVRPAHRRASPQGCAVAATSARARARSGAAEAVLLEHDRRRVDDDDAGVAVDHHPVVPAGSTGSPRAPTTAGMSRLRATIAVCEVVPPTSVMNPVKTLRLNCSMSAGAMSLATSTRGRHPRSRAGHRNQTRRAAANAPTARRPARRPPCVPGYSSSMSSNWRAALPAAPTAPTPRCSAARRIQCLVASLSASSCSSIRCTSSKCGEFWQRLPAGMSRCSAPSSGPRRPRAPWADDLGLDSQPRR